MKRIPVVPTVIVLLAVAYMIHLGLWQLDRLKQKEAMLAQYEAASTNSDLSALWPDAPEAMYRRVYIYCDNSRAWSARSGRNEKHEAGWAHIVRCNFGGPSPDTPAEIRFLNDNPRPVDVVIGWSSSPMEVKWNGGRFTGTVAPGGDLGFHVVADPPLAGLQPNAKPDPRNIPNNHLAYAVQWFLFAGVALVIYALALRKRLLASA